MSVRALPLLLLLIGVTAMSAEQPPQLEIRYLDEMEDISQWKSLASDGVSASVHSAKGVEGNALVLEFNLANTAGYAAATGLLSRVIASCNFCRESKSSFSVMH